jgi:hypothetical protein
MEFYDEVLRELLVAMGAALFVGNLMALLRRRTAVSPGGAGEAADAAERGDTTLPQAPVGRTVAYMVMGFVVALWGLASLLAG